MKSFRRDCKGHTTRIRAFTECQELCRVLFVGHSAKSRTRYRITLGKDRFTECRTLGKDGARQRVVSGRLKMTAVTLCRESKVGTRQRGFFAECQLDDTRQRPLYRVPFFGTRQSTFLFFLLLVTKLFVVCFYTM